MSHHDPETAEEWKLVAEGKDFLLEQWKRQYERQSARHMAFRRAVFKLLVKIMSLAETR